MIKFEVRQLVKTAVKNRVEVIYETQSERMAEFEYDRVKKEFPGEYFEWVRIETNETCLAFTPMGDDGKRRAG